LNESVGRQLRKYVAEHGRDIFSDPERLQRVMGALFPGQRLESSCLARAVESDVPAELAEADRPAGLRTRLVDRVIRDSGLSFECAEWAVDTWAEVVNGSDEAHSKMRSSGASARGAASRAPVAVDSAGRATDAPTDSKQLKHDSSRPLAMEAGKAAAVVGFVGVVARAGEIAAAREAAGKPTPKPTKPKPAPKPKPTKPKPAPKATPKATAASTAKPAPKSTPKRTQAKPRAPKPAVTPPAVGRPVNTRWDDSPALAQAARRAESRRSLRRALLALATIGLLVGIAWYVNVSALPKAAGDSFLRAVAAKDASAVAAVAPIPSAKVASIAASGWPTWMPKIDDVVAGAYLDTASDGAKQYEWRSSNGDRGLTLLLDSTARKVVRYRLWRDTVKTTAFAPPKVLVADPALPAGFALKMSGGGAPGSKKEQVAEEYVDGVRVSGSATETVLATGVPEKYRSGTGKSKSPVVISRLAAGLAFTPDEVEVKMAVPRMSLAQAAGPVLASYTVNGAVPGLRLSAGVVPADSVSHGSSGEATAASDGTWTSSTEAGDISSPGWWAWVVYINGEPVAATAFEVR
jgi:hypothetical protein